MKNTVTTALVLGATGATGREIVDLLVEHTHFDKIYVLVRRPLNSDFGSKVQPVVSNPLSFDALNHVDPIDVVFCALGTTQKKAGSKQAFYKIDHDLIVDAAIWAKAHGVGQFHVISSQNANTDSSYFYLRTKGETEQDLINLDFSSLTIYRPTLLYGGRREEARVLETLGYHVLSVITAAPINAIKRYKPVHVKTVASAMVSRALSPVPGAVIVEAKDL
jgi:uncharacterized protein YbjT (DUF2867 family)